MLLTIASYEECWAYPDYTSYLLRHPTFSMDVPNLAVGLAKADAALHALHHGDCVRVVFTISEGSHLVHWGVIGCRVQEGEDVRDTLTPVDFSWLVDVPQRLIV